MVPFSDSSPGLLEHDHRSTLAKSKGIVKSNRFFVIKLLLYPNKREVNRLDRMYKPCHFSYFPHSNFDSTELVAGRIPAALYHAAHMTLYYFWEHTVDGA